MSIESRQSFRHPAINKVEVSPMATAMVLRKKIIAESDRAGVHPFNVIMEQRLDRTDSALKAMEIKQHYMQRDGIVSDLHGLDDDTFGKIRESVLSQRLDRVFFLGDIGGSVALAQLQTQFYEGFYNKYKALKKEGAGDNQIFGELKEGFTQLLALEKHLESYKNKSIDETKTETELIPDNQLNEKMKKYGEYGHYGHYVSDQSEQLISYLASDVEHYYERFVTLATELRTTGAKVYVIQGNWDARLPFDFEAHTDKPVPLPVEKRRFNAKDYFKNHGVPYFNNIGAVESNESFDIMVPFDAVAKTIGEEDSPVSLEKIKDLQKRIKTARKAGKTVSIMTHAVPDWTKHGKLPTGEGEITQKNLQKLVSILNPDELIYGHEHFMRKDLSGNYLDINSKFKLHTDKKGQIITSSDQTIQQLNESPIGTVTSFLPKPTEPYNAYALRETPRWPVKNRRPRGAGGLSAPTHVGREAVPLVKVDNKNLPTADLLFPMGKKQ